ncbi:MAG: HEAT repeat domain-containing protein [Thermoanaerobaculia bacterium]
MPTLVHITNEKNAARIERSGIAASKWRGVVYFMPVLQDHFISHQWLRELKRRGARVLVGVYFRLPSSETVWIGKYDEPHRQVPLGEAIGILRSLPDPLGFEMFVERKIEPREIVKVRHLPQKIGWRYKPRAHGTKPCGCSACQRGRYGSRKIQDSYEPRTKVPFAELKAQIEATSDPDALWSLLCKLRAKRRYADPAFLERLLDIDDEYLREDLEATLACFRHKNARLLLAALRERSKP